jgi:hypothetical protein
MAAIPVIVPSAQVEAYVKNSRLALKYRNSLLMLGDALIEL